MTTVNITIPDAVISRIVEAFTVVFRWDEAGAGLTKNEFVKKKVQDFIREVVSAYEANLAAEVARKTAIDKSNTDIILS